MAPFATLLAALALLSAGAHAQLPNARIGLAPDTDAQRQRPLREQAGYELKERDIPFGERYLMEMTYYPVSEQPLLYKNKSPFKTACCYPANAYWTSNVAIHPYWFREFGLDRWCRRDVCLSVWLPDRSHDLMFKVTDVCDPKDCPTPLTFKAEPQKGRYLYFKQPNQEAGWQPKGPVHAYFVKCWADAMPQPDLQHTIPGPYYANSRSYMIEATFKQWERNQAWNRKHGRPVIPIGSLWRPEATQTSAPGFRASDYPPGSSAKVKSKYQCGKQG